MALEHDLAARYLQSTALFFGARRLRVRFPRLHGSDELRALVARHGEGAHLLPDAQLDALQRGALEDAFDTMLGCWPAGKRADVGREAEAAALFAGLGFAPDGPLLDSCFGAILAADPVESLGWAAAAARAWPVAPEEIRALLAETARQHGVRVPVEPVEPDEPGEPEVPACKTDSEPLPVSTIDRVME
jgi:hypothetical protein